MLDNVIDINYYAVAKARNSNLRHRPVGLGIMGFQDCLHLLRIAVRVARKRCGSPTRPWKRSAIYAYLGVDRAGRERGRYSSYRGSLWDRGILPQDSLELLARRAAATSKSTIRRRWTGTALRARISNTACATPTAWRSRRPRPSPTSSACAPSIEPTYQNLYVKSNLSGEFTVVNDEPGARPEGARPVGRGDGRRPEVLRRHRWPRSTVFPAICGALRDGVRNRRRVAGRSRRRVGRNGSTRRSR